MYLFFLSNRQQLLLVIASTVLLVSSKENKLSCLKKAAIHLVQIQPCFGFEFCNISAKRSQLYNGKEPCFVRKK